MQWNSENYEIKSITLKSLIAEGLEKEGDQIVKKVKVCATLMAHRAVPISVSSSPRPHICKCSEGYCWGLVH